MNASETWFDVSSKKDFDYPSGDRRLIWKDKGYRTILDLLMVIIKFKIHFIIHKLFINYRKKFRMKLIKFQLKIKYF